MRTLQLTFCIIFVACQSQAQVKVLAAWPLTNDGLANFHDQHVIPGTFSVSGFSDPLKFSTTGAYISKWPLKTQGNNEDPSKYFEASITSASYPILITDIRFRQKPSATGVQSYKVRYSLDGFANSHLLAEVELPGDEEARDGHLEQLNIELPPSTTLTIRWYGYSAGQLSGTWRIVNSSLKIKGIVLGAPYLEAQLDTLPQFAFTDIGESSVAASYLLKGGNLTQPVTLNAAAGFELSTDQSTWSHSLSLPISGSDLPVQAIHCRFVPQTKGLTTGNIFHATAGAMPLALFLSGAGVDPTIVQETFENIPHNFAYGDYTWVGDNGNQWSAQDALLTQKINESKALTLRNGKLVSPLLKTGIKALTLTTQSKFGNNESGVLTVSINGVPVGSIPYNPDVQTSTISGFQETGPFILEITSPGDGTRAAIDDLQWTAAPLKTRLITFSGKRENGSNTLTWQTTGCQLEDHFQVERSRDGRHFERIQGIRPDHTGQTEFTWADHQAESRLFYRLHVFESSGDDYFSPIVLLESIEKTDPPKLLSNLTDEHLVIEHSNCQQLSYFIHRLDGVSLLHGAVSDRKQIAVHTLSPGFYLLQTTCPHGRHQFKFVKRSDK